VGGTGTGRAPAATTLVTTIDSPPLSEVVGEILQHSDNMGAEMLVKELGVRFGGAGSTAAGLAVIRDHLAASGAPMDGVATVDGSGLDRSDHLTCQLLQQILAAAGDDSELARALPVAGRNGTLYKRFVNSPAAGKVRAKTGSLLGVAALTGFATGATADGTALHFSLLANELPTEATGARLQDNLVDVLAAYPQAPPAEAIGPR